MARVSLRLTSLAVGPSTSRPLFAIASIATSAAPSSLLGGSRCTHSYSAAARATLPSLASSSTVTATRRYLATHSDGPWDKQPGGHHPGGKKRPETVEETLRRLESEAQCPTDGREYVGPFPLGVGPSGRRKPWKPWQDLGIRGKRTLQWRAGARTQSSHSQWH